MYQFELETVSQFNNNEIVAKTNGRYSCQAAVTALEESICFLSYLEEGKIYKIGTLNVSLN